MKDQPFESLYRSWFDLTKAVFPFLSLPKDFPAEGQTQDWQSEFEKMSKSILELPPSSLVEMGVGPSAEAYKDHLDLMKSQIELYRRSADIWTKFSGVWAEGTQAAVSRMASEKAEKSDVDPGKRAYNAWVEELEKRFDILIRDEEFSTKLGSFVSSYLEVKRRSDGILERYCSRMNIPTRSEIDGMYKKMHDLEKKVDRLSRSSGGGGKS
jgi:Poly(R)-hydroxyalkanoic acid synthase subunit (PHA_synth_III_E)